MDLASADPYGLLTTAAVTAVYQLSFFIVACGCKFDKLTDFAGGTNFALLALLTFLGYGSNPDFDPSGRQLIVTVFASVWAVRLACFLLFRILAWGEDRRFDDVRNAPLKFAVFWIYQAVWVWTTMLNVTIVNTSSTGAKMMNFAFKTRSFVSKSHKTSKFLFKMMNFAGCPEPPGDCVPACVLHQPAAPTFNFLNFPDA